MTRYKLTKVEEAILRYCQYGEWKLSTEFTSNYYNIVDDNLKEKSFQFLVNEDLIEIEMIRRSYYIPPSLFKFKLTKKGKSFVKKENLLSIITEPAEDFILEQLEKERGMWVHGLQIKNCISSFNQKDIVPSGNVDDVLEKSIRNLLKDKLVDIRITNNDYVFTSFFDIRITPKGQKKLENKKST